RLATPALDAETLTRAIRNLDAPGTRSVELARALQALADSDPAPELCRAAVWVISRMDQMSFLRAKPDDSGMDPEASTCDLKTVEARAFYENIFYAVKAKHEFPWGVELNDHDFFNFVLSPRGTGEPLQRWRRLFYEALAPEVRSMTRKDLDKAIALATNACYDFYQYEGETTWEDFGTLSGLAVHEGRCEDCSNMENAFLRTIAIPGCQAFTPFWATADGNHAWTWIPAFGMECGEGRSAVKLFVKTWDALEDVTDKYVPVTTLTFEAVKDGEAELRVWNMEEWRRVARVPVKDGKAVFEKVGCPRDFALAVRIPGEKDRVFALAKNGTMSPMQDGPPGDGALETTVEEKAPAIAAWANPYRGIEAWTVDRPLTAPLRVAGCGLRGTAQRRRRPVSRGRLAFPRNSQLVTRNSQLAVRCYALASHGRRTPRRHRSFHRPRRDRRPHLAGPGGRSGVGRRGGRRRVHAFPARHRGSRRDR
ncbi:MAG: hypothetical protein FD180_5145, partial [Planctomycetota bacterium]